MIVFLLFTTLILNTVGWIRAYTEEEFLEELESGEFGENPVFYDQMEGQGPSGSYSVIRAKYGALNPKPQYVKSSGWQIPKIVQV